LGYYKLGNAILTQRCGRTGRTNNGFAYVLTVDDCFPYERKFVCTEVFKSIIENNEPMMDFAGMKWGGMDSMFRHFWIHFAERYPDVSLEGMLAISFAIIQNTIKHIRANPTLADDIFDSLDEIMLKYTDCLLNDSEDETMISIDEVKGTGLEGSTFLLPLLRLQVEKIWGDAAVTLLRSPLKTGSDRGRNNALIVHEMIIQKLNSTYIEYHL